MKACGFQEGFRLISRLSLSGKPELEQAVRLENDVVIADKGPVLFTPYPFEEKFPERTFRRLCKRLGIPRITPHMLRHYLKEEK